MSNNKWELLKAPIMAVVTVMRLMPGIPTYDTRILFYFAVVVPFLPIFNYASILIDNDSVIIATFCYFLFYLLVNILITQQIKKLGKTWGESEYKALTQDQITFPFILVCLINATIHFGLYYSILNFLVL